MRLQAKEHTGYYIKVDSEYTNVALDILSDMLFHSTFDPKKWSEKKVDRGGAAHVPRQSAHEYRKYF